MADLSGPLRRRNYGRNHAYYFGDHKVPGVTTIIGPRSARVAGIGGFRHPGADGCARNSRLGQRVGGTHPQ